MEIVLGDWRRTSSTARPLTERYQKIGVDSDADTRASMWKVHKDNEIYIKEVIIAMKTTLQVVVDEIIPHGNLMHLPVRTYYRILNCAVTIWKVDSFFPILLF
ncbi:hypothetical protein DH86_00003920 [Scytalidium sp. 3C]|nr:hypothetical protein DH86_00003920 [Scytalidium sp. 3C]